MSSYKSLSESLGGAVQSGYQAKSKSYERSATSALYADRNRNRSNLFSVLYGALSLGSNLYDVYSQSQDTLEYATDKGYESTGNWWDRTFKKDGANFSESDVMARKSLNVDSDEFSRNDVKKYFDEEVDWKTAWDNITIRSV